MIGSLHLDPEDEPRRLGATSRANSVRFDETANQGHWAHTSRSSLDFMPRAGPSSGGLPLTERSSSHKSDGRASSVHSVRSAASGRASSLNLESGFGMSDSGRSPFDSLGLAPGLLILGSVPAIIRCWMSTNFKHDALLYAAVCSGSHKSFLSRQLIEKLNLGGRETSNDAGVRSMTLPVYLPEAIPHPSSSRSGSPAPQLPTLTVTFTILETSDLTTARGIQIVLGSDILRTHNADILFSTNKMSIIDDDRNKLSVPLVRPEEERTFSCLRTVSDAVETSSADTRSAMPSPQQTGLLDGLGQSNPGSSDRLASLLGEPSTEKYRPPEVIAADVSQSSIGASEPEELSIGRPPSRNGPAGNTQKSTIGTKSAEDNDLRMEDVGTRNPPTRSGPSPAVWSSWRREGQGQSPGPGPGSPSPQFDWANTNRQKEPAQQRRDTGIKVLRPMKTATRTLSGASAASPSPSDGKSRFFDDGKRRGATDTFTADQKGASTPNSETASTVLKENQMAPGSGTGGKTRNNPAGGASAFQWLNQGGQK